jgi:Holliday junction resolvasome RuvABC endonuclease subunit
MTSHVVLALDIALRRTGWAVGWPGMQRPFWGVHDIAGDWDGREGERLTAWRRFLEARLDEHTVTCIAMELPFIDNRAFSFNGTVAVLQMQGIALELAHARGIRAAGVAIASWRAHWIGQGVAPKHLASKDRTPWLKDMAMKRAAERGWLTQFHDEAEALGIMDFALACLDAGYDHKVGPMVRRAELRAEVARFRGETAR